MPYKAALANATGKSTTIIAGDEDCGATTNRVTLIEAVIVLQLQQAVGRVNHRAPPCGRARR